MDGTEIAYSKDGEVWVAREKGFEGRGLTQDEATTNLLKASVEAPVQVVGDQTVSNKASVCQTLDATTSKLIMKELRNKTPEGMSHVAYYDDAPDLQGYGTSPNAAKLNLFTKRLEKYNKK